MLTDRKARDSDFEAGQLLRRAVTALAARARAERPGDLPTSSVAILSQLARHGAMTPGEMATRLHAQPQSLTRPLMALQDQGFLARTSDPGDRRQALLSITSAGRAAVAADMRPRDEWMARAIASRFTEAERDLLIIASGLMLELSDLDASPGRVEP
jgi:DNA-binding MarR family transcriptional regulator